MLVHRGDRRLVGDVVGHLGVPGVAQRDGLHPRAGAQPGVVGAGALAVRPDRDDGVPGQQDLSVLHALDGQGRELLDPPPGHVVGQQLVVAQPHQQVAVGLDGVRLVDLLLLHVRAGPAGRDPRGLERHVRRRGHRCPRVQAPNPGVVGPVEAVQHRAVQAGVRRRLPAPGRDHAEPAVDVDRQERLAGAGRREVGVERDRAGDRGGLEAGAGACAGRLRRRGADEGPDDECGGDGGQGADREQRPPEQQTSAARPAASLLQDLCRRWLTGGQRVPEVLEVAHTGFPWRRERSEQRRGVFMVAPGCLAGVGPARGWPARATAGS